LGFIEQTGRRNSAVIDAGAIEGEVKLAAFMVSAVMNRICLENPGAALFPFLFELPVGGGGTDGKEFSLTAGVI
jgi:hypothetical protein